MDRDEAARVLGVRPTSGPDEIRQAYRALIRVHHPDRAGSSPASTDRAATIIRAYEILQAPWPTGTPDPPHPTAAGSSGVATTPRPTPDRRSPWAAGRITLIDADTLALEATAEDTFLLLLDAAHELGEVTYVDPDVGLLEARVQFEGTPACSLVFSLQGRNDRTDVFCTIESLDARPAPDIADVVQLLATLVKARLSPTA